MNKLLGITRAYKKVKAKTYQIVQEDHHSWASKAFDIFIISLILSNVLALILETVDSIEQPFHYYFRIFDRISVYIFSVEYLLRLWVINCEEKYRHPLFGRLRYIFSFSALIDLGAVLPFYIAHTFALDGRILRLVRIFRIFRIFKFHRYSKSAELIGNVLRERKYDLIFSFGVAVLLLLMLSSLMYFIEHKAQPENFSSIPATLWWGIITLTTVGYGDVYPVTDLGKILAGTMAVLGIGIFALPAGILANGFGEEIRKRNQKDNESNSICPHCGKKIHEE